MSKNENLVPEDVHIDDPGKTIDLVQGTMDNFLAVADVKRVFDEPVKHEAATIIPTAEVVAAMGFGAGYGSGGAKNVDGVGLSSGGGGGGRAFSRPVAVIIADEDGVRVEPVIDFTKILLTAFTAFGFMIGTIAKMRQGDIGE